MNQALRVEIEQATHIWIVNRPQVRNAIDADVVAGLEAALAAVEQDPSARAVILTGTGDAAFIAGANLKRLRELTDAERTDIDLRMTNLMTRLEALPLPVFAALNGVVLGGGCEIALACDVRIAEPHASLTFKHAAMGVTPGWGGLLRLSACVGRSTAAKLLFTAEPMTAQEALRVGLVDELVGHGESVRRAKAMALSVAQCSPAAIADLKRLLSAAYARPELRDEERRTFLTRAQSRDHAEAVAAFAEKRAPRFDPR